MVQLTAFKTAIIFSFMLAACYYDLRYRRIPNKLLLFCLLTGLLTYFTNNWNWLAGFILSLCSMGIAFIFMLVPYKMGQIGAGDVKLFASLAVFYEPGETVDIIFLYCIIILFLSFYTVIINFIREKRIGLNASYPMAPFIAGAFLLHSIFWW